MTDEPRRRGPGRPKGSPASDKQKATVKQAQQKAREAKAQRAAERKALEEKPRWKKLEDGDITFNDLTDEELIRGEVANNDGSWEGKRHTFEPRMINKMRTAYKRRFSQGIEKLGPLVLEAFEDILGDDEARSQQVAVGKLVAEYTIGKPVEVIHVGQETEWDRMQQSAFVVLRGVENVENVENDDESGEGDVPAIGG